MRSVIVTLLLSVFVVVPWASAQTAGPSVPPVPPRGGEAKLKSGATKAGPAGQVVSKRTPGCAEAKKPVAVKTVKNAQARRPPAKPPAGTPKRHA